MKNIEEMVELVLWQITAKTGTSLSYIQKTILKETLCEIKKTYSQIAEENNYSENYIKYFVAPNLWKLLSKVFEEKVNKTNCRALIEQKIQHLPNLKLTQLSEQIPQKTRKLEQPEGQVPLDSNLYIERHPIEFNAYREILQPGAFIRIKAPKKMGKTSFMARIIAHAANHNYHTARLSLNRAETKVFASTTQFLRWLCANVTQQIGLDSKLDEYWDDDMGALMSCTIYFQNYLLKNITNPILLALDEVNQLFEYKSLARDVLALLRSWHEETKDISVWQNLRLAIAHSTDVYVPLPINQSPFNVGLTIELPPFTLAQIEDLAQRHGLDLTASELELLMYLTGGFPYLVRLALYESLEHNIPLERLLKDAAMEGGIFSQYLHAQLWYLRQNSALSEVFQNLLEAHLPIQLEQEVAFKLKSLGLVNLDGSEASVSCGLYKSYFCANLHKLPACLSKV